MPEQVFSRIGLLVVTFIAILALWRCRRYCRWCMDYPHRKGMPRSTAPDGVDWGVIRAIAVLLQTTAILYFIAVCFSIARIYLYHV